MPLYYKSAESVTVYCTTFSLILQAKYEKKQKNYIIRQKNYMIKESSHKNHVFLAF